ncbi:MAG TPA: flagellar basal body rod protein FlgB [Spongiibacteraceae bacterium]|nr:flagellar basal body rod protein FlgB [Spongiibacteraceae bacterium]HCS26617.1 flagellar basal body rod protein FlgB [Spongiibacteraceae bacterium]
MPIDFQTALGVHEQALYTRARRTEVLGANMANTDTPGYKARDIDFRQALAQAQGASSRQLSTTQTSSGHIAAGTATVATGDAALKYRNPHQPSEDGNTVELHVEQANFADNAVRYQATLTFLGGKFSGIKTALTGGR